jgi:DNA-binding GntR family transcriptional regulator
MNLEHVARVEARTLKANVTDILRQLIIEGTLAPGTEFNQAQIAEQLGVSRGPIREALGQLEQEGLVQSTPYKGVIITPLTRKYVEELYSVRTALELMGLDYSVDRMTDADIQHLDKIVDDMRAAARDNDLDRLVEVDLYFHEYLLQQAQHELALKLWRMLEVGIRRCLRTRHQIYTFLDEVVGSHPTLITALAQRDKVLAKQILGDHVVESVTHILANWPPEEDAVPPVAIPAPSSAATEL